MQDAAVAPAARDLAYYLAPIKRRTRVVVAFVVLGLVLGGAAAAELRPTYTAITSVLVQCDVTTCTTANNQVGGRTQGPINMDTEAQVAHSQAVATVAHGILGNATPIGQLLSRLKVGVPPNTTILRMSYTAHSPQAATDGANAFANAYLQNRRAVSEQTLAAQEKVVRSQIKSVTSTVSRLTTQVRKLANGLPRRQILVADLGRAQNSLNGLTDKLNTYLTTELTPGQVQSVASASGLAPSPLREIAIATGLILGLLVGLIAAFLRDRSDPTVRAASDVESLGVAVIADIPKPRKRRGARRAALAAKSDALARRKAYQRVATGVASALGDDGGSVYVASLAPTALEHGLSASFAQELGRFGSSVEIAGNTGARQGTPWDPEGVGQQILRANRSAWHNPEQIDPSLPTRAALAIVEQALSRSRFVLIDGAGDLEGVEPYVLASLGQVGVIIVQPGETSREELADIVEQMRITSCPVVGVVLWHPPTGPPQDGARVGSMYGPPRAIAASDAAEVVEPLVEPDPAPPAGPTAPGDVSDHDGVPPAASQADAPHRRDEMLGWPEPGVGGNRSAGAADEDIEDAEIVDDDPPQWSDASRR